MKMENPGNSHTKNSEHKPARQNKGSNSIYSTEHMNYLGSVALSTSGNLNKGKAEKVENLLKVC